jgi:hypothetical protein
MDSWQLAHDIKLPPKPEPEKVDTGYWPVGGLTEQPVDWMFW